MNKVDILFDHVYPNTRIPTQLNTNQHESKRINTSPSQTTRARHESIKVNKSKRVKKSPRRGNASQQNPI